MLTRASVGITSSRWESVLRSSRRLQKAPIAPLNAPDGANTTPPALAGSHSITYCTKGQIKTCRGWGYVDYLWRKSSASRTASPDQS